MKRILASVIILILFVPLFSVLMPSVKTAGSETTIFQDDFESYAVGTFPSAGGWQIVWNGAGNQYQVITSSYSHSGTKSLQLIGADHWSSVTKRDFSSSSDVIGYEGYMMTASVPNNGSIGFFNQYGATWGVFYAGVGFSMGNLVSGSQVLQPITPYAWYKVRVELDKNTRLYNVSVNDVLAAQNLVEPNDPHGILSLEVSTGWFTGAPVYFDDVKVFEREPIPTVPVISSVSPITASNLQTIHIYGSGFGNTPPQTVPAYDSDGSVDTVVTSTTPCMGFGNNGNPPDAWAAGVENASNHVHCAIGIYLTSWSDTEIVLGGFGMALHTNGQGPWNIAPGDPLDVAVFTPSGEAHYKINVLGISPIFGLVYTCISVSAIPSTLYQLFGQPTVTGIIARVSDQLGNRMPGVMVSFTSTAGTLSSARLQTDEDGKAQVTLALSQSSTSTIKATVTATANGASASTVVTFIAPQSSPTKWDECNSFQITPKSISLSSALQPAVDAYNAYVALNNRNPFAQPMQYVSIGNLPQISLYLITKASSASQDTFTSDVAHFFGINPDSGYDPTALFIMEFPLEPLINTLFSQNYQEQVRVDFPVSIPSLILFDNAYVETTPNGYLNLAFSFSSPNSLGTGRVTIERLETLATSLASLPKLHPGSFLQGAIETVKEDIESIGDPCLSVITSDLNQAGQLSSYVFVDFLNAIDRFTTATGLVLKVFDVAVDCLKALVSTLSGVGIVLDAVWFAKGCVTILDFALEIIPLLPGESWLKDNYLYQLFKTGVGILDPPGDGETTAIMPSFYNSTGSLVLGYNSSGDNIIYASAEGILIPFAGNWLAFLNESASNPVDYVICLNAVGGNGTVVYDVQILSPNQNVTAIEYAGMVLGGTSISISVNVAPDGTLVQQVYLDPALSISETRNVYDFVATGLLSNGSLVSVTKAFLIINDSQYEMAQDNSSTFEIQTSVNLLGNVSYFVYMISPNVPGGFASGILRPRSFRIMGDVNGDDRVDMSDVMILLDAFGSYPGRPRWNPDCDLNQDGRIDLADIVMALMNFGQHYP